jgi:hypothetical protein
MDNALRTEDMIQMVEQGLRMAIQDETQPENPLLEYWADWLARARAIMPTDSLPTAGLMRKAGLVWEFTETALALDFGARGRWRFDLREGKTFISGLMAWSKALEVVEAYAREEGYLFVRATGEHDEEGGF